MIWERMLAYVTGMVNQQLFILSSGGKLAIWSFVPGWHLLAIFAVGPWFDGSLGTSLSSGQS
jgi:hypothetical protein